MKRTILIASGIATGAAVLLSLFIREDSIGLLSSMGIGVVALVFALAGCFRRKRPLLQTLAAWLIPAALFIAITTSHLPLRMVFWHYRADFDRVAQLIETGTPPTTPFWIGPFRITMVGRRGDDGTLYVATNKDKSEIDGFVPHPQGHGFNLWSCIQLDERWSYIAED